MARLARVVAPGVAHHVTQRGNRRQRTFFGEGDYRVYLDLASEWFGAWGLKVWAWCLMPNHVHLIVVPPEGEALARGIGEVHRRYTRHVNFRKGWRGYLWQGRFGSCPMDAAHTLAAARYIERNPVRAGLVKRAWQWPWSSAAGHVSGRGDALVKPGGPLVAQVNDWRRFLAAEEDAEEVERLRRHLRTGRPLGNPAFIARLESRLRRTLRKRPPGPKPKRPRR